MNKQARARFAKETINNVIPRILNSNSKARNGVRNSELIHYDSKLELGKSKPAAAAAAADAGRSSTSTDPPGAPPPPPPTLIVSVVQSDTYDAVHKLLKSAHPRSRIAALNMASALHPGGGVLRGALAQEESLCVRSTLLPGLQESFYRVPETAAIYSPDVLVFRSSDQRELPKEEWFFVDVISCAALKNPGVVSGDDDDDDAHGRSVLRYEEQRDTELMVMKVRLILQVAQQKGITHLVLGALGCGAYKNPPEEVARIFKRAIYGHRQRAGVVGIEEIVFAIFDDGDNLRAFRHFFEGDGL